MTWYLDQVFREIIHFHYIFLLDQVPLKVAEVVSCKKFTISLQLCQKRLQRSCFPVIFVNFFRTPVGSKVAL